MQRLIHFFCIILLLLTAFLITPTVPFVHADTGDWNCMNGDYSWGDGKNGYYQEDASHVKPGSTNFYCGRNQQCIGTAEQKRINKQYKTTWGNGKIFSDNPQNPCVDFCICAIQTNDVNGHDAVLKTNGYDVNGDYDPYNNNTPHSHWGYYCGNGDIFPDQYRTSDVNNGPYTTDPSRIILPPSVCNAQSICAPFPVNDASGHQHDGLVQFVPISGNNDCACKPGDNFNFTCNQGIFNGQAVVGSQDRNCGANNYCRTNITWSWPCSAGGSTPVIPTQPPASSCTDPATPFLTASKSDTSINYPPSATPFPLPCLEGLDKGGNTIPGPSTNIVTCTKFASGVGDISPNISDFLGTILGLLLGISGGIAALLIIYSGYELGISQGNPEKIKAAKERLTAAIVGLLFIIFSTTILQIIGVDILHLGGFVKFH